jgi:hypothetical protein
MAERAVEDLAGHHPDQATGVRVVDRQGIDPQLVDPALGLGNGGVELDGEDPAGRDVDRGRRRRHLLVEDSQQLLADLHRHAAGDAGRGRGGVPAASEALRHPSGVQTAHPGPDDQVAMRRPDQHHHSDRDLEGLHPAVDHVGCLFVVAVDLDHRQLDRRVADEDLLTALDDPVEQLELIGLQGFHHPAANPLERSTLLEQPGHDPQVGRGGLPVGQAAGVLVDAHQEQRRLLGGRRQLALPHQLRHDRAGGPDRSRDDLAGAEQILLGDVVVDQGDRAAVARDQLPDLAQAGRVAGVGDHDVVEGLAARLAQLELGEREPGVLHEAPDRHLLRAREQHLVVRKQAHRADRRRERVEIGGKVGRDRLHGTIVGDMTARRRQGNLTEPASAPASASTPASGMSRPGWWSAPASTPASGIRGTRTLPRPSSSAPGVHAPR